jgi:small subunit ribosomal protein S21
MLLANFLRARSIDALKNPGYYVRLIQKAIPNNRIFMPEVIVRKGEPIDRALKRLKNKLDAEGIMEEVRRLRAFETPSQKVRRKAKLAAKRGKLKFRFNP